MPSCRRVYRWWSLEALAFFEQRVEGNKNSYVLSFPCTFVFTCIFSYSSTGYGKHFLKQHSRFLSSQFCCCSQISRIPSNDIYLIANSRKWCQAFLIVAFEVGCGRVQWLVEIHSSDPKKRLTLSYGHSLAQYPLCSHNSIYCISLFPFLLSI